MSTFRDNELNLILRVEFANTIKVLLLVKVGILSISCPPHFRLFNLFFISNGLLSAIGNRQSIHEQEKLKQ